MSRIKRNEWELRNGRMVDSSAKHDLYKNEKLVLEEKSYDACREWIYEHGDKSDLYMEGDNPDYKGDTIGGLKRRDELQKQIYQLMDKL